MRSRINSTVRAITAGFMIAVSNELMTVWFASTIGTTAPFVQTLVPRSWYELHP